MCLRIYLRESRKPLGFCNRYVGTGVPGDAGVEPPELASAASADVTTAFGALEQVDFAALHVERVVADIDASRGLDEAAIVAAHAPLRVKAGETSECGCSCGSYRGRLRTVSFPLRIPARRAGADRRDDPRALGAGAGVRRRPRPHRWWWPCPGVAAAPRRRVELAAVSSLAELRQAIAAIPSLRRADREPAQGVKRHVFRDPSLLITGRRRWRSACAAERRASR